MKCNVFLCFPARDIFDDREKGKTTICPPVLPPRADFGVSPVPVGEQPTWTTLSPRGEHKYPRPPVTQLAPGGCSPTGAGGTPKLSRGGKTGGRIVALSPREVFRMPGARAAAVTWQNGWRTSGGSHMLQIGLTAVKRTFGGPKCRKVSRK